mgnify:CR=1 FL=1
MIYAGNNTGVDEGSPHYKEVEIEEKNEFGNLRYYPTNQLGKEFAKYLGTKTLSLDVLNNFIIGVLDIPVNFKQRKIEDTRWKTRS